MVYYSDDEIVDFGALGKYRHRGIVSKLTAVTMI